MGKKLNLVGQIFGRLTAIDSKRIRSKSGKARTLWICNCTCGTKTSAIIDQLTSGKTQSCGCLQRERTSDANTKHNHNKNSKQRTQTYNSWANMIQRCTNPNSPGYKHWGGRGIAVCTRWHNSFSNFLEDMGDPPTTKHSIDRIDNSKGYKPGNCRWATQLEQKNNTRHNHYLTYNNETLTIAEWSRRTGIKARLLHARVTRLKWSIEKAITTPPDPKRQKSQLIRYKHIKPM